MHQSIDPSNEAPNDVATLTIERELELIREAIAVVASGASSRVVVASLRFGDALVEPARLLAAGAGVRIVPLWTMDESHNAIAVERANG